MKRFWILMNYLIISGIIYAQQPVDYLIKAKALSETGKDHEAVALLSEAILKYTDYRFYLYRAEVFMNSGEYNKASADFLSANSLSEASGEFGLAKIFAMKGDAVNSLKHLKLNLNSDFKKSEKVVLLEPAFSSIENTPEWRQFWKNEWYTFTERKISEIEYYISAGKKDEAVMVYRDLAAAYPDMPGTLYAGAIVSLNSGKAFEAVSILTGLIEGNQKNEKYLRLLGDAQYQAGNPSGASLSYSELILRDVPDAGLLLLRAECYNKTGETEKALNDVKKYLGYYPESKKALSFAGRLEGQSGDNLKALDYFSRNLKLHPGDPECFIDRGNSYFVSKTWGYAINDYSMALDIQPRSPEIWLNKGIALYSMGKTDDACHDFRTALNLGNKKAAAYVSRYCIK